MKKTKLALFQSVVSLLLCISMLAGTTFAWFTDSVTSGNNIIKSGKLDVTMEWFDGTKPVPAVDSDEWIDASTGAIFNYSLWEPGYTQVRHIKIANEGNLALKYQLKIVANGTVSNLADVIDVYYTDPAAQVTARSELTADKKLGTLTDVLNGLESTANGSLIAGENVTLTLALKMQETAGNEYQNLSIGSDFSVILLATQEAHESDSFGTDYDKEATFDFPANNISVNVSGDVDVENGAVKEGTTLNGGSASAVIPAGVQMAEGNSKLTLTISEMAKSGANLTLGENEAMRPLNVHVEGIAANNTIPMEITIKEAMPKGLNMGNYKFYHVENGNTVEMTAVDTFTAHNQFKYDPATGDVTLYMATFSEVALVADTVNAWNGTIANKFAGGSGEDADPYLISNADQLAYLNKLVSTDDDNYGSRCYKLISNINLGGNEKSTNDYLWYPIGYWKEGGTAARTASNAPVADYIIEEDSKSPGSSVAEGDNTTWYTYGGAFQGTFDGAGHEISNIYQNTWELKGDYCGVSHYWDAAMGLFGYVYGGTIKNLTVENFSSDGEFTPTGVIAAFAVNSTFENIAITNCNPRVYNTGNGGIVGIGGNSNDPDTYKLTFTNITIDNSNKISALWGSWDVACGGLVGMFRGAGHVHMTNCHVAAQIDVFNDVCGNYQYYWYRYAGMMVGTNKNMVTDANGYTVPETSKFHAENCTVHFGKWNDYYYCELVANSLASYTHDHQFSRLEQIQNVFEIQDESGSWKRTGNFILMNGKTPTDTCYHIVKDANGKLYEHKHADAGEEIVGGKTVLKENNQRIYLPFNQLFTGYGWGVKHIPVYNGEDYAFNGITILDREVADSKVKFDKADIAKEAYQTETTVTIGELFKAGKIDDEKLSIKSEQVQVTVSPVGENSTAGGIYTADTKDWTQGSLTFSGTGEATITITDYYFCTPTTITVNVTDREPAEKFESKFTGDFLYRVGNAKDSTVALGTLFEGENVTGNVSVSIEAVNGTSASGTYTSNATWQNGTIQFNGTGVVKVTIKDDDTYCTPTELNLEVVDAVNATSATSAKSNNVVLLNDCGFSSLEVSGGYTLYGNGFTMTCSSDSAALDMGYSFVTLNNGTLDNVQIVCPNFDYAVLYKSNMTESGNRSETTDRTRYYNVKSGVMASGNSKILNSRISGGRAAVNVSGGNLVIDKSRIELGAVASVLVGAANSLTLRNVTLVQKPTASTYDSSKTLMGFSVLYMCDSEGKATPTTLEGKLVQNAWVNADDKKYVPSAGQDIVDGVMKETAFIHNINGKDSLNLGFAYMPEDVQQTVDAPDNITDNRTDKATVPYEMKDVKIQISILSTTVYVYSYKNTNGTDNSFNDDSAYKPSTQSDNIAVVYSDTADGLETGKSFGSDGWVYELNVDLDKLPGYALDFSKLSMTVNGTTVTDFKVNDNAKPTSPVAVTAGGITYTLSATVNGKEYTASYKVTGTETSKESPSLVASNYEPGLCVASSYGGTWHGAAPALEGIQIKYWSVAEKQYKTINLSDYTPTTKGQLNGTNTTWTYSPTNGDFTLTLTGGQVHSSNNVYAMPVVCDGKLYFVAAKSNGLVNSGNSARTIPVTYIFKDNNNGDVLTFSHTWSVAENKDAQYKYSDFCNGTLTKLEASSSGGSGCVTPDTLITLADGSQVRVDSLTGNEELLVWNLETGKYDTAPIVFVDTDEEMEYEIIHLYFSDCSDVKVISEHGFFDLDLGKYVYIDADNYSDYIGHRFVTEGSIRSNSWNVATLKNVVLEKEVTTAWSPVTFEHLCYYTNGVLSMPGGIEGLFNIFEVDTKTMRYDAKLMQKDIDTYGLLTLEDFDGLITQEAFDAFNGAYLKVAMGKGLLTWEDIAYMAERYIPLMK